MAWYARDAEAVLKHRLRTGELIRVAWGAFVAAVVFDVARDDPWRVRRMVYMARVLAVGRRLRADGAFTGSAALLLWGVDVLETASSIDVAVGRTRSLRRQALPGVRVGSVRVGPGVLRVHLFAARAGERSLRHGVPVTDLETVLLDVCRTEPMERAIVSVSMAWHDATRFDRSAPQEGRRRERELREGLLRRIDALPRRAPGAQRARLIARSADAAVESVAEARMVWFLLAHRAVSWQTQTPVRAGGRTYYPDFVFPSAHVAIEVDGMAKLGAAHGEVRANVGHLFRRSSELQASGLEVVHVSAAELSRPGDLADRLRMTVPRIFRDAGPISPEWSQ